jgi:hypothetical protein
MLCVCVGVGGKTDGAGMEGGGRDDIRESKRRRGGKGGKDGGKEGGREIDKSTINCILESSLILVIKKNRILA